LYLAYHEETKDEAQQRIWTFYEAIKIHSTGFLMEKNLFLIKFESTGQFDRFYKSIKQGQVFIPVSVPVSEKSHIILKIIIPVIDHVFLIYGDASRPRKEHGKSGIRVDISDGMESVVT